MRDEAQALGSGALEDGAEERGREAHLAGVQAHALDVLLVRQRLNRQVRNLSIVFAGPQGSTCPALFVCRAERYPLDAAKPNMSPHCTTQDSACTNIQDASSRRKLASTIKEVPLQDEH